MHTGTTITDLLATVERVSQTAERQQIADRQELHEIFSMNISLAQGEPVFVGAA